MFVFNCGCCGHNTELCLLKFPSVSFGSDAPLEVMGEPPSGTSGIVIPIYA